MIPTRCCKKIPERIGRANYKCPGCDKDVSLEVFYFSEAERELELETR